MTQLSRFAQTLRADIERVQPNSWAWGGGGLVAGAFVAFGALSIIATPTGRSARLEAIQQQIAQAERLSHEDRGVADGTVGAICRAEPQNAATQITAAIKALGAKWGVRSVLRVDRPSASLASNPRLQHTTFILEGEGAAQPVYSFMADLATVKPVLIADQVDLQSSASSLSLKIAGSFLCWR